MSKETHTCPVCGVTAKGYTKIDEVFGWTRDAGAKADKPISYCKEDRRLHGLKQRTTVKYKAAYPDDKAKRSLNFMLNKLEGKKNRDKSKRVSGRSR